MLAAARRGAVLQGARFPGRPVLRMSGTAAPDSHFDKNARGTMFATGLPPLATDTPFFVPPLPTSPALTPLHLPDSLPEALKQRVLADLRVQDFSVVDDLLGRDVCLALWAELNSVYEGGHMKASMSTVKLGQQVYEFPKPNVFSISDFKPVDPQYSEDVRRLAADHAWATSPIPWTLRVEAFLGRLLCWIFDGSADTLRITNAHPKVAVSVRPSGACRQPAFYVPHFDTTSLLTDRRRVTAVYYPNPHWQPGHGGHLRCYPLYAEGRLAPRTVEVGPCMDRLVLFRADVLLHDVGAYTPPTEPTHDADGDRPCRRWAFVEWASEPEARALPDAVQKQALAKQQFSAVLQAALLQTSAQIKELAGQKLLRPVPPP